MQNTLLLGLSNALILIPRFESGLSEVEGKCESRGRVGIGKFQLQNLTSNGCNLQDYIEYFHRFYLSIGHHIIFFLRNVFVEVQFKHKKSRKFLELQVLRVEIAKNIASN